jgi:hypothetical protein
MGLRMRDAMMDRLPELRLEPTEKRIRVLLGDHTLVDTTPARLVWEPRRLVPSYAVPRDEVHAELQPDQETITDADRGELPVPRRAAQPGLVLPHPAARRRADRRAGRVLRRPG